MTTIGKSALGTTAAIALGTLTALAVIAGPAPAQADNGCIAGYVPRLAAPSDVVCVTPTVAARTAQENTVAANFWVDGAYGPQTCVQGLVWREAFDGDTVCVTPDIREQTWADNAAAASRIAADPPPEVEEEEDEEPAGGGGGGDGADDFPDDGCAQTAWDEAFGGKDYNTALCEPEMLPAEEQGH